MITTAASALMKPKISAIALFIVSSTYRSLGFSSGAVLGRVQRVEVREARLDSLAVRPGLVLEVHHEECWPEQQRAGNAHRDVLPALAALLRLQRRDLSVVAADLGI